MNSLELAEEKGIRSVAFPSISTGAYSYPLQQAADIAIQTVKRFIELHPNAFDNIIWVLFDTGTKDTYNDALEKD